MRFRKHDLAAFHLLDPLELNFTFHRPMRFLDMEGGSAVFAEPSEIADRYHTALSRYLQGLRQVVVDSAVDYHRVTIDSDYEQVLLTFLIGRTRGERAMSFLQPWLLAALPLAALPVIIHLINQRRFQTIDWGAMMFLLAANRMSRGYARIRQWLILAFRVLAIAALVFLISRPLATGWLGLAGGGRPDTTIVLIDRSPSMTQQDTSSASSKLQTGLEQLGANAGHARLGPLGRDRQRQQSGDRTDIAVGTHAVADDGPRKRVRRPAGDAANRPRLRAKQSHRPDRNLDLLRPARERLERRQRPLENAARQFSEVQAERAVPSAGVSGRAAGKRGGARERHPAPHDGRHAHRYSFPCT